MHKKHFVPLPPQSYLMNFWLEFDLLIYLRKYLEHLTIFQSYYEIIFLHLLVLLPGPD